MFCSWDILKWNLTLSSVQTVGCLGSSLLLRFSSLGTSRLAVCCRASSGTAVTGTGPLGNAVQPAAGLWCTGSACPPEAAGETGDPKDWLHPPWVGASHSCVSRCLSCPHGPAQRQERGLCPLSVLLNWCVVTHVPVALSVGSEPDLQLEWALWSVVLLLPLIVQPCGCSAGARGDGGTAGTAFWSPLPFRCQDLQRLTCFGWLLEYIIYF